MNEKASSSAHVYDEWSVTLDGRYVVRFCGVNAQELATRQLHELAELLGFEDSAPGEPSGASAAASAQQSPRRQGASGGPRRKAAKRSEP